MEMDSGYSREGLLIVQYENVWLSNNKIHIFCLFIYLFIFYVKTSKYRTPYAQQEISFFSIGEFLDMIEMLWDEMFWHFFLFYIIKAIWLQNTFSESLHFPVCLTIVYTIK